MTNSSDTRDQLALERTLLANERTLLAYIRTGLSLLAAAALLLHLFASVLIYTIVSWLLVIFGVGILVVGILRFKQVRKKLAV